jgi:hypothetical protein
MLHSISNQVQESNRELINAINSNPKEYMYMLCNDDDSYSTFLMNKQITINKGHDMHVYSGSMIDACSTKHVWWHGIGRYILAIVVALVCVHVVENSMFNHYKRNIWNNIYSNTITQEEGMQQLISLYHDYNK